MIFVMALGPPLGFWMGTSDASGDPSAKDRLPVHWARLANGETVFEGCAASSKLNLSLCLLKSLTERKSTVVCGTPVVLQIAVLFSFDKYA